MKRNDFVRYWAKFVRNNPDRFWSEQQKVIIDSQLQSKQLTRKQYLKIKKESLERLEKIRKGKFMKVKSFSEQYGLWTWFIIQNIQKIKPIN